MPTKKLGAPKPSGHIGRHPSVAGFVPEEDVEDLPIDIELPQMELPQMPAPNPKKRDVLNITVRLRVEIDYEARIVRTVRTTTDWNAFGEWT